jgi:hypothetical protein
MKFIRNLVNKNSSSKESGKKISAKLISDAYETRKKEIESLREYDRGEKEIHAPRLGAFSKSI